VLAVVRILSVRVLHYSIVNLSVEVLCIHLQTSAPKKWTTKDGRDVELDTPHTLRARQLRDTYNTINMKHATQDERLDALLTLKHTVQVWILSFIYSPNAIKTKHNKITQLGMATRQRICTYRSHKITH